MKKVSTLCMIIATTLFFGCEGPEGPLGPQGLKGDTGAVGATGVKGDSGAVGANGTAGADGTNGKDGNANVVYSEWLSPTWSNSGVGGGWRYYTQTDTRNSMLTQEAIDKGVVYTYVTTQRTVYNNTSGEYELIKTISQNAGSYYFKIPGRETNESRDFTRTYFSIPSEIGVNYMRVNAQIDITGPNEDFTDYNTPIPELTDKSFAFYTNLMKDLKYRVVVVHGSTKGRIGIDMSDYSAVKKAYNLPD